jgi:AcrR family transcriptional regulator
VVRGRWRAGFGLWSAGYSHAAEPAEKGEREERRVETVLHDSQHGASAPSVQPASSSSMSRRPACISSTSASRSRARRRHAALETPKRRPYRMKARAEATAATRDAILDAAAEQFLGRWFDEVTLAGIAEQAGVSQQTVVNHFGSKEGLLEAAVARIGPERARRGTEGDPVARVVADYENGGDATIRMLALEERVPALGAFLAAGRAGHRAWVQEAFADRLPESGPEREQSVALHIAATDIYVWKLLRRDMGMSRTRTIEAMRRLVDGLNPRAE